MTAVHQFLPTFAAHDAIGNHVVRLQRILRAAGFESEIFADDLHNEVRGMAHNFLQYDRITGGKPAYLLYHLSTGSRMAEWLANREEPLLVDYHNITEAKYFERWAPLAAESMRHARREMQALAPSTRFALADSAFNEAELIESGYKETAVAPILIDFTEYETAPSGRVLAKLERARQHGGTRWLFVGRVAPNKCHHDIVAAFAAYRALYDPRATLTFVGGMTAHLYWRALESMVTELDLGDAVTLADAIPFPELLAHYRAADVFVSLSEHEGFLVPAVEAMYFDVPVVAYAAGAVPGTIGDAGIVLDDKDPVLVAAAVHRVVTDTPLRESLVVAGRARVEHFSLAHTGRIALDTIRSFVEREESPRG